MWTLVFKIITVVMFTGGFIWLDGFKIVGNAKNQAVIKYKKFRKLNKLVSTHYRGICTIVWVSLCMITRVLYLSLLQKLNNSLRKIDMQYELSYVINGQLYKILISPLRGPRRVLLVYDDQEEDMTDSLISYMGPEENFHGGVYTPDFFDKNELVFEMSTGEEKIFKRNDIISLN